MVRLRTLILFFIAVAAISTGVVGLAQLEEDIRGTCTWIPVIDPICIEGNITVVNHCFAYNKTIIHNGTCTGHEEFWP